MNKKNFLQKIKKEKTIIIIIGIILILAVISSAYIYRKYIITETLQQHNLTNKLNLVSTYGDSEAYHPKVLKFDDKWNGYKYWMSYTPYPKADDSKENPHIVASNNLIDWETPKGLINPLDERYNDGEPEQYDSDAHLVYNKDLDRLECYWRFVDDINNDVIIYRRCSNDGINFTEKEIFIKSNNRKEKDYVSPAIIYENGTYKMWYVDKKKVKYQETKDCKKWTNEVVVLIKYEDPKLRTWHLDVVHTQKGYEMLTVAYTDINKRGIMDLYYSCSSKEVEDWDIATKILSPKVGTKSWDNKGLYRSTMIMEDDTYIVFYSGISDKKNRGIGIAYGNDIKNLKRLNIKSLDEEKKFEELINEEERI